MATTQSQILTSSPLPSQPNTSRSTKRKIDDAFYHLDKALLPSEKDAEPKQPASKRMRLPSSLVSTLSKFGIKSSKSKQSVSDDSNLIKKKAPHLSAILSRSASRREKEAMKDEFARASVGSISTVTLAPVTLEYRPSSTTSFLQRLATFKLSTYSMKPNAIDAVAASKVGWVNDGKERLACGICKASWVLASRDGMTRDAANSLVEKQRGQLVSMHKDGCPWKIRQCDDSIYCLPLKAPSTMAKDIKQAALEMDCKNILEGVEPRHPLTGPQVQNLMSALASVRMPAETVEAMEVDGDAATITTERRSTATEGDSAGPEPSQLAALIAVFGWSLATPHHENRSTTGSLGRTDTATIAHGPSISATGPRQSSIGSSISVNDIASATARPSRIPVSRSSSAVTARLARQEGQRKRDETLLSCSLCQRRVGLWTFKGSIEPTSTTPAPQAGNASTPAPDSSSQTSTEHSVSLSGRPSLQQRRSSQMPMPKRQFDLLKEHRSYCPYVVRSTTIPSLSSLASTDHHFNSQRSSHSPPSTPVRPSMHPRTSSATSFNFTLGSKTPAYPAPGTPGSLNEPTVTEGWRAVVTVVLRTGMARRQRMRGMRESSASGFVSIDSHSHPTGSNAAASSSPTPTSENGRPQTQTRPTPLHERSFVGPTEIDGIHAMVDDVKAKGGKELLRYVRSLFQ